jgi:sugar/nucleoside kinase (ribokinase family)
MVDVVCAAEPPHAGTRVHAGVSVRAGGSAVNAALAAVALGAAGLVVGRVGSDSLGDLLVGELAGHGIDGRLGRDRGLPTGAVVAFAGAGPAPAVVAHRGANAQFAPGDVPDPLEADALFVSGFALLQEGSADAACAALERFTGRWAGVDTASPRLAAAAAEHGLERAAPGANVVLATAEEARALTGAGPEESARALASRFTVACVKLGEEGAVAAQGDRVERRSPPRIDPGSSFGSGDAFAAGLLVALARGASLGDALELGCQAGAAAAARAVPPDS